MRSQKVHFKNSSGEKLAALLELPPNQHPHNFVVFAHCFTCSKNLLAVRNIARSLSQAGFGVLRFDFTGLGNSEGEFSESNFSSNISDISKASEWLSENYKAPSLLIGHSLGGAAVIHAAHVLENIKAVATIGAPSEAKHLENQFESDKERIESENGAEVNIGGRPFKIRPQFIKDLRSHSTKDVAQELKKPLAIFHSPQDKIVGIDNAQAIYESALHPKSFISLDGADHLLSKREDSDYVGRVVASWATRYLDIPESPIIDTDHEAVGRLEAKMGFITDIRVGQHGITADEPRDVGGQDFGPSPYELLSSSLAACTAMTLQMYAKRKKWDLQNVEVHINHNKKHCIDCKETENNQAKIDHFSRSIKMEGDLDEKQRNRLLEIADKCPVHRTLHSEVKVETKEMP